MTDAPDPQSPKRTLPRGIWVLGFVSLMMDVSSEMIHSLLPLFLVTSLGASAAVLGLIEGLAEAVALIIKIFSGALSDYLGRRKGLALLGYGLSAATKPLFALAGTPMAVLAARLADRVGKGIRGAPRDALIADMTPPEKRGAAFGLRQSLDTIGAFLGPLMATGLMLLWAGDFRAIFWVALAPALLAVSLLGFGIKEPPHAGDGKRTNPLKAAALKQLSPAFWRVAVIGAIFALARFSEAFLLLRATGEGLPIAYAPLVMVAMNIVYALSAYPFGWLSDRLSRERLLMLGLFVLIAADVVLASAAHWGLVFVGVSLWGLHMGMTQGLMAAMVATTAPADLRGTAFGFFNLLSGIAMLAASVAAGLIWDKLGPNYTFYAGAGFCVLALLALVMPSRSRA
ncbi:MFS transporter [Kordiimonas marina]|uniref:MFS transporter n=1 Tax=Kordiimonas marina TaxID=2872312 RepID=UPI001FF4D9AC|nr:MFS transporter [Kordiimonas marina]MCJ9428402.1 MFS transporter [Kordiimonas marina]